MKLLYTLGWLGTGMLALAQTDAPKEEIDLPARRQSVVTMKEHMAMRQARLDEVVEDLKQRGDGIDERIGKIVDSLAKLKDSESSKTRISQLKGEAASGLMKMIGTYQTERRRLIEQAKKDPKAPLESLTAMVKRIDAKVETRSAQVVKLVDSIPGEKDVKKYENSGGSLYGNGWGWSNDRISDAWRQNRRDGVESKEARDEAQRALRDSIADLERRRDAATAKLKSNPLSDVEREIQKFELDHVHSVLDIRRKQLVEVTEPSKAPTATASKNEADDMKQLFEDAVSQLSADFNDSLRLYHQAMAENDKLYALKLNLAEREKWLSENDPEWKKGS
jgi:hypothetical protein